MRELADKRSRTSSTHPPCQLLLCNRSQWEPPTAAYILSCFCTIRSLYTPGSPYIEECWEEHSPTNKRVPAPIHDVECYLSIGINQMFTDDRAVTNRTRMLPPHATKPSGIRKYPYNPLLLSTNHILWPN